MPREFKPGEPVRFIDEETPLEAKRLADELMDDESMRETAERFIEGLIGPRELAYEIQIIVENIKERRQSKEVDAMDERELRLA